MAKLVRLLSVVLALTVAACGGGSPNAPTPVGSQPPGASCPTGVEVEARIVYKKLSSTRVSQDPIDIGYAPFSSGNLIMKVAVKVDDYTFTFSAPIMENAKTGFRHRVSAADSGLMPNPTQTATDIYVNDVLVVKAPAPGGIGETGYFRIDGCGKVMPATN